MRVPFDELHDTLRRALADDRHGGGPRRPVGAALRRGLARRRRSHGLNRFPRFMRMIGGASWTSTRSRNRSRAHGALERWDGRRRAGQPERPRVRWRGRSRSPATHGIGCVALANTNHWMRGGSYGWQAADAGRHRDLLDQHARQLPPWGAADPRIGNNPLVIAVPRRGGHVVLDMAMSQFSVGGLASYRSRGELLPVAGGYDAAGALSARSRPRSRRRAGCCRSDSGKGRACR